MFVEVNGRIWDYEDYKRRVLLVKNYANHSLKEALKPHGFSPNGNRFYNEELDLVVELNFLKKNEFRMV